LSGGTRIMGGGPDPLRKGKKVCEKRFSIRGGKVFEEDVQDGR